MLASFSPAAAQSSPYAIGIADSLNIRVETQPELTGIFAVNEEGSLNLPLLGRIKVEGLTTEAAETRLKEVLEKGGYLRNARVSVTVETIRSQRVFVVGGVRKPGAYPISRQTTLTQALLSAGWFDDEANSEVLLVRAEQPSTSSRTGSAQSAPPILRFSADELRLVGPTIAVYNNDTVSVAQLRRAVQVLYINGRVRFPGLFPLAKETTVSEALELAGGYVPARGRSKTHPVVVLMRIVDVKRHEFVAKDLDVVKAGDLLTVSSPR